MKLEVLLVSVTGGCFMCVALFGVSRPKIYGGRACE